MASVQCAGRVFDPALAVDRVGVDHACVLVSGQGDEAGHVSELGAEKLKVQAAGPGLKGEEVGWEHRRGFELGPVSVAVKVLELVYDGGQDAAFPRANFFREGSTCHECYGVVSRRSELIKERDWGGGAKRRVISFMLLGIGLL